MKPKSLRGKALRTLEILSPILPDKAFIILKFRLMIGSWPHLKHPRTFNEKLQHFKLYDRNPLYTNLVDKAAVKDYVRAKLQSSHLSASAPAPAVPAAPAAATTSPLAVAPAQGMTAPAVPAAPDSAAPASEFPAAAPDDHLIPTLGVWDCFDRIDFASLPASFVLKCTHDSGSAIIVRDKDAFLRTANPADFPTPVAPSRSDAPDPTSADPTPAADRLATPSPHDTSSDPGHPSPYDTSSAPGHPSPYAAARAKLTAALSRDYSLANREWPYHDVPRRIIAEPYLADLDGLTDDYKFFCRDGSVRFLFVATGRSGGDSATRFDFFDPSWRHLPLTNGHPCADTIPARPANFDAMLALASKLSEGLPFVRVDLYNLDGRILFGEYTFSHWGGFKPFDPPAWDLRLGQLLD